MLSADLVTLVVALPSNRISHFLQCSQHHNLCQRMKTFLFQLPELPHSLDVSSITVRRDLYGIEVICTSCFAGFSPRAAIPFTWTGCAGYIDITDILQRGRVPIAAGSIEMIRQQSTRVEKQ
jgi:hypothetical protein